MNKEIIDCIQADIDSQKEEEEEKDKLIFKIYNFFNNLPNGRYRINTTVPVKVKTREHWYSKPYIYTNYIRKELWLPQDIDHITINIDNEITIASGIGNYDIEISKWDYNNVKTFYEHLSWFETELAKQYGCSG